MSDADKFTSEDDEMSDKLRSRAGVTARLFGERAIRPIALGRKNHLFAGSDGGGVRWATICSLIATAKLNNVEPFAWLRDVLQRMTDGHPASRLDELLPWNWQPISVKA